MRTHIKTLWFLLVISLIPLFIFSQPVEKAVKPYVGQPEKIIVEPPSYYGEFDVNVWVDKSTYYIGEDIRIGFRATRDSYIYIFNTDASGDTRQIFPNYYDRDNSIRGNRTYYIPDHSYNLRVIGPSGREYIRAVAIRERYRFLDMYQNFSDSEPFPQRSQGPDTIINNIKSEAQRMEKSQQVKPQYSVKPEISPDRKIIIEPPIVPHPPTRYYAEDQTSFRVAGRERPYGYGKVRISSSPDDARVYIDGRYYGKTTVTVSGLEYGQHFLEVYKKGYRRWTKYFYVDSPETIRIKAYLVQGIFDWFDNDSFDVDIRFQSKYEKEESEEPTYRETEKNKWDIEDEDYNKEDSELKEQKISPYSSEKEKQQSIKIEKNAPNPIQKTQSQNN